MKKVLCPHCEYIFERQLFMKLAPIQVALGKPLFCPQCGRRIQVESFEKGHYDVGRLSKRNMNSQNVKVSRNDLAHCPTSDIVNRVSEAVSDNYDVPMSSVSPTTKLEELDVYEYDLVALIMRLEFDFGITFQDEEIDLGKAHEITVQYISECVQKHMSERPAVRPIISVEPDQRPTAGSRPEKKWWQFWK